MLYIYAKLYVLNFIKIFLTFQMQKLLDEVVNKNRTLSSWTRERVDSVARLEAAWERLLSLIDNHQHLISKQVCLHFEKLK